MKVVGFITEYNPFHYGHKYHLKQSLKSTKADYSIAIMSGSFMQRGEPSLVDKWTRAEMAVKNGVDLVIELPFIFSSQSAELFAYGGVKLMDSLNIVDFLVFGSELGELEPLKNIASILYNEPEIYKNNLKKYLSTGLSYSVSRSNALEDYINNSQIDDSYDYKEILNKSNNILGIEYLKSIYRINSSIIPITIGRSGNGYNDTEISNGFASATAIRNLIKTKGLESIKNLVPSETYYCLEKYVKNYEVFNSFENYNDIFLYLTRTLEKEIIGNLLDIEPGLENRIIQQSFKNNDIIKIVNSIVTKRYPRTRIQRLFVHLLNQLYIDTFKKLYSHYPTHIRVLAANKNGLFLLNKIKSKSSLPIITKFADYKNLNNQILEEVIMYDKKATDLFFLGIKASKTLTNMDYYISPFILSSHNS